MVKTFHVFNIHFDKFLWVKDTQKYSNMNIMMLFYKFMVYESLP